MYFLRFLHETGPSKTISDSNHLAKLEIHDIERGLHYFDLKRGSRRRLWQESPFAGALCFARAVAKRLRCML